MSKRKWLCDKTIVISGASSGIGRGLSKYLIEKYNCNIIGIGRNEDKMKSLLAELGDKCEKFSYQLFDVSKKENWENFHSYIEENNIIIDVLINNAGVLPAFDKFENQSIEKLESTMEINFYSYVYSYSILLDNIKKSNTPAVINICSSDALCPLIGTAIYSSTKSAIKAFTECVREENRGKIYISNICPGFTKTDIFRDMTQKPSRLINLVSMKSDKMVKKIAKAIIKKKGRKVIGFDAKLMDIMYRIFPRTSQRFFKWIFKISKVNLFDNVFDRNNKGN